MESGAQTSLFEDPRSTSGRPAFDDPNQVVSSGMLAAVLGITQRRVQQLGAEGTLPKVERGKYPLGPAVQAYIRSVQGQQRQAEERQEDTQRFRRAKAEQTELAVAKARGEVIPREEVAFAIATIIETIVHHIARVPRTMARRLLGISDAAVMQRKLNDELRGGREAAFEALEQLASDWELPSSVRPAGKAAPKKKPGRVGGKRKKRSKHSR